MYRLLEAAEALGEVRPDLSHWLSTVARKIGFGVNPGRALELTGPAARRERNRLLLQAAICLRQPGDTTWGLAQRLAARVKSPPRHPDLGDQLLDLASRASPLPQTPRQLYNLLLNHL